MDTEDSSEVYGSVHRTSRFLEQINNAYSPVNLDCRAENSFGVAVKFFTLLRRATGDDDEAYRKLMTSWFKAVRDNDYRKFKRALRKYYRMKESS